MKSAGCSPLREHVAQQFRTGHRSLNLQLQIIHITAPRYNILISGFMLPRRDRDWAFHVPIPEGHEITGVVQADQLRSASWEQRGSRFIGRAPASVLEEVRARLKPLLSL